MTRRCLKDQLTEEGDGTPNDLPSTQSEPLATSQEREQASERGKDPADHEYSHIRERQARSPSATFL